MNSALNTQEQGIVAEMKTPGPGDRLRKARLALDIDIGKMADRLHLTPDMVEALERDDYSNMSARVFVRGYLRNYAREVNLPDDAILEQFDRAWPVTERPMTVIKPPRLASDSYLGNRWGMIFTWLIVLSAIALFLVWWQGYLDDFLQQRQAAPEQTVEPEPTPDIQQPDADTLPAFMPPMQPELNQTAPKPDPDRRIEQVGEQPSANAEQDSDTVQIAALDTTQPATLGAQPETNQQTPPATTSTTGVRELTIDQSDEASDAQTTASGAETEVTGRTEEVIMELRPIPQVEQPVANNPVVEPEPATSQPEPKPELVTLSFKGRCWVDIRDSTRTFKLVGEMNAGDTRKLGGKPPYTMIIGNASAAQILVGGKPYDLKPYTNGDVARVELNP